MVAEVAIGGVEADPAGTGEINFGPGVEGTFGVLCAGAEFAEISAGQAGGEAEAAGDPGEEHGEIAAGAAAESEGLIGSVGGAFVAAFVGEAVVQGRIERNE